VPESLGISLFEGHVGDPPLRSQLPRLLQHLRCQIDPDHVIRSLCHSQRRMPRSCADVEHPLRALQLRHLPQYLKIRCTAVIVASSVAVGVCAVLMSDRLHVVHGYVSSTWLMVNSC